MIKYLLTLILLVSILFSTVVFANKHFVCENYTTTEENNIELVKSIFTNNVWKPGKDEAIFAKIYSKNFIFSGNGSIENYQKFKNHMSKNVDYWKWNHVRIADIFAHGDKVIVRLHVKAESKKGKIYELDSMELFQIKDNHVLRWWETSYPDWRQMVKESGETY